MENIKYDTKFILGIILIIIGILFMLDTMNIISISISYYLFSWKTFLIFLGIIFLTNKERKNSGIILITIGILFWLPSIFGFNIRFSQVFWPSLLIVLGFILITRRNGFKFNNKINDENDSGKTLDENYLNDLSIFGGSRKVIYSKNFKGGTITSVFGSSEINMMNADIGDNGCVIDIFTLFGGTTLKVPNDWKIQIDAVSVLGSINDKRNVKPSDFNPSKLLVIKGMVIFGGTEIKNY
jgi:predicted membrane protein